VYFAWLHAGSAAYHWVEIAMISYQMTTEERFYVLKGQEIYSNMDDKIDKLIFSIG
jgi:hypothetical protein